MKKLTLFLIGCTTLLSFNANAVVFNHKGIQKGATSESCYHDPCSIVKVMDFKLIENKSNRHVIKLKVVSGTQGWNSKKILWGHDTYNIFITCSVKSPTIKIGNEVPLLPINRRYPMPGVLYGDGVLYSQACHNFDGDTTDLAKKYGYNITQGE